MARTKSPRPYRNHWEVMADIETAHVYRPWDMV